MNRELHRDSATDVPEPLIFIETSQFLADLQTIGTVLKSFCGRNSEEDKEPVAKVSQQLQERLLEARRQIVDLALEVNQRDLTFNDEFARNRRQRLRHALHTSTEIVFLEEDVHTTEVSVLFDSLMAKSGNARSFHAVRNQITYAKKKCYVQSTTTVSLGLGLLLDFSGNSWRLVIQRTEIQENAAALKLLLAEAKIALFEAFQNAGPYASSSALQPKSDLGRLAQQMILDWHTLPETMTDQDHLREAIGAIRGVKIPASSTTKLMLVPYDGND